MKARTVVLYVHCPRICKKARKLRRFCKVRIILGWHRCPKSTALFTYCFNRRTKFLKIIHLSQYKSVYKISARKVLAFMLKQNHKFVNNLMRKNRPKTLKRTYCNIKSNKSATFCNMNILTYIARFVTIKA